MAAVSILSASPDKRTSFAPMTVHSVSNDSTMNPQSPQYEPPEEYLESLLLKQRELSGIAQDVPPSPPSSHVRDEAFNSRVESVRARVRKAFEYANGDPADGKWVNVVRLLHLRSTMGGVRWLGTNPEANSTGPSIVEPHAETQEDHDQELGQLETQSLRTKVQVWQENLEAHEPSTENQVIVPAPSGSAANKTEKAKTAPVVSRTGSLKNAKLSFPVVKRSSFATTGKPNATPTTSPPPPPQDTRSEEREKEPSDPSPERPHRDIADVSEASFLPPSFPSDLITSTPTRTEDKKHKPAHIPRAPDSLDAVLKQLPSPPIASTSSGDPTFLTPSRPPRAVPSSPQKRARSVTPGNTGKRARSGDAPEEDSTAVPAQPETPTHKTLPTLTELLASSKRSHKRKGKAKALAPPADDDVFLRPAQSELLLETPNSPVFPPLDGLPQSTQQLRSASPLPAYDGAASPTKSLSSLAASDSEDEEDGGQKEIAFGDSIEFNPPFFSTQPENVALAKAGINDASGTFMGYNSQVSVNDRIDEVVKFMDDDIDYDKWMKYPEPDEDES